MMRFLLWLSGFGRNAPENSPPLTSPTYLFYHWYEELGLYGGSAILTLFLGIVLIGLTYAGQYLGGHSGRQLGFDLGLGVLAFGGSGALTHFVRYYIIRVYLRLRIGTWDRDQALNHGPRPGPRLRRFIVSTNRDFVAQVAVAMVTVAIALWIAP